MVKAAAADRIIGQHRMKRFSDYQISCNPFVFIKKHSGGKLKSGKVGHRFCDIAKKSGRFSVSYLQTSPVFDFNSVFIAK